MCRPITLDITCVEPLPHILPSFCELLNCVLLVIICKHCVHVRRSLLYLCVSHVDWNSAAVGPTVHHCPVDTESAMGSELPFIPAYTTPVTAMLTGGRGLSVPRRMPGVLCD